MAYDCQRKQRQFLGVRGFETVNHDSPAHVFLQESNSLVDQKPRIGWRIFYRNRANCAVLLFDDGG